MKLIRLSLLVIVIFSGRPVCGQYVSAALPEKIAVNGKYIFYLHGGVVTSKGNNGITASMPQWGPYEYLNILDSLSSRGFNVISENRKEGVDDSIYVNKIVRQVDSLRKHGVPVEQTIIIGASAGAAITLAIAARLNSDGMRYVIMGACWPDTYKRYQAIELKGRFLSIIEKTDPHGTCAAIFEARPGVSGFKEIVLNTGLSHAFMFKGYKDWIDPVIKWFNEPG